MTHAFPKRRSVELDLEARLVVAGFEADVVEHEEFGFGTDIDGIADAGRGEIGLGTLRGRARVARIAFAGRGFDDVAEDDEHRRGREGRSEEHTSALPSLLRISYAIFCLNKN